MKGVVAWLVTVALLLGFLALFTQVNVPHPPTWAVVAWSAVGLLVSAGLAAGVRWALDAYGRWRW